MANTQQFHIGIEEPNVIRRQILENTKSVILILQRYENFKQVRKEKKEVIQELENIMKDVDELNKKLKEFFPSLPGHNKVVKPVEKVVEAEKTEPVKKRTFEQVEKLSTELESIEAKLAELR